MFKIYHICIVYKGSDCIFAGSSNGIFNDLPDYCCDDQMGLEISIIENHSSERQTFAK